jgi:hypothetical protein
MRTGLGLGGNTLLETSLGLTTGDGRCNRNLRKTTSVWTTKGSINGLTLREKG